MSDRDHCQAPELTVLGDPLRARDALTLDAAERHSVAQRLLEAALTGSDSDEALGELPDVRLPGGARGA